MASLTHVRTGSALVHTRLPTGPLNAVFILPQSRYGEAAKLFDFLEDGIKEFVFNVFLYIHTCTVGVSDGIIATVLPVRQ
jgi:hypothetical protein